MLVAVIAALTVRTTLVAMAIAMVVMVSFFVGMIVVTMCSVTMMTMVVDRAQSNQGGQWHNNIGAVVVVRLCWCHGHKEI